MLAESPMRRFRPSYRHWRDGLKRRLVVVGLLVAAGFLHGWVVGLIMAALLPLTMTVVYAYGRMTELAVQPDRVELRRPGRNVTVGRGGLVGLVAPLAVTSQLPPRLTAAITDGRRTIVLDDRLWHPVDLAEVGRELGLAERAEVFDAEAVESLVPGLLPWRLRHPWLHAVGVVIGTPVALLLAGATGMFVAAAVFAALQSWGLR